MIPKSEQKIRDQLRALGMGLRHRRDLRSWEIYQLGTKKSIVVRGGYSDIINEARQLIAAGMEAA